MTRQRDGAGRQDEPGNRAVGGTFGGYDEKEQTLDQLLAELDGFDPRSGVILLAATNRPEILDPAPCGLVCFESDLNQTRPMATR